MKKATASFARFAAVVIALGFLGIYVLHSMGFLELPFLQSRASRQKIMASSKDAIIYEAAIVQWEIENARQNSAASFQASSVSDYIKASTELVRNSASQSRQGPEVQVVIGGSKSVVPVLRGDQLRFPSEWEPPAQAPSEAPPRERVAPEYKIHRKYLQPETAGSIYGEQVITVPLFPLPGITEWPLDPPDDVPLLP